MIRYRVGWIILCVHSSHQFVFIAGRLIVDATEIFVNFGTINPASGKLDAETLIEVGKSLYSYMYVYARHRETLCVGV